MSSTINPDARAILLELTRRLEAQRAAKEAKAPSWSPQEPTPKQQQFLDLTCLARDASALMLTVVTDAAREISRRLYEAGSRGERMLLEHFLAATRRWPGPIRC